MTAEKIVSFARKQAQRENSSLRENFCYPFTIEKHGKESFLVHFPQVPEALTEGDTRKEAVALAQDCLIAALGFYIKEWRPLPIPRALKGSFHTVSLPTDILIKLNLVREMQEQGVSISQLAKRLSLPNEWVKRYVNLDRFTIPDFIDDAFKALNKRVIISLSDKEEDN